MLSLYLGDLRSGKGDLRKPFNLLHYYNFNSDLGKHVALFSVDFLNSGSNY